MRTWEEIAEQVSQLETRFKLRERISVRDKLLVHADVWKFFLDSGRHNASNRLKCILDNGVKSYISLGKADTNGFSKYSALMQTLFHNIARDVNRHQILRDRILVVRRERKEQIYVLRRMQWLVQQQRTTMSGDETLSILFTIPDVLFFHVLSFIK